MISPLHEESYQVRLPVFEGPLDLLLQLIEREKLDISAVSLAQVTEQFLSYVRELERVEAEILADFLVVAARLVWIKSRLLLPRTARPSEEEEEEDPAEVLARQLREYKRFKEAAGALRIIEETGRHTYLREAAPPDLERRLQTDAAALAELLVAAHAALAAAPAAPPPEAIEGMVVPFTLTIHDQIGLIRRFTAGGQAVAFRTLLRHARYRLEIIVTLLAVLELIKRRQILVAQDEPFGEIFITPIAGAGMDNGEAENGEG